MTIQMKSKGKAIYLWVGKNDVTFNDPRQHEAVMLVSTGYVRPTFSEFKARTIKPDEPLMDVDFIARQDVYGIELI